MTEKKLTMGDLFKNLLPMDRFGRSEEVRIENRIRLESLARRNGVSPYIIDNPNPNSTTRRKK
ncbi:MAG: hypothetical protein AAB675_01340 [Patescibacteria group bacterium]